MGDSHSALEEPGADPFFCRSVLYVQPLLELYEADQTEFYRRCTFIATASEILSSVRTIVVDAAVLRSPFPLRYVLDALKGMPRIAAVFLRNFTLLKPALVDAFRALRPLLAGCTALCVSDVTVATEAFIDFAGLLSACTGLRRLAIHGLCFEDGALYQSLYEYLLVKRGSVLESFSLQPYMGASPDVVVRSAERASASASAAHSASRTASPVFLAAPADRSAVSQALSAGEHDITTADLGGTPASPPGSAPASAPASARSIRGGALLNPGDLAEIVAVLAFLRVAGLMLSGTAEEDADAGQDAPLALPPRGLVLALNRSLCSDDYVCAALRLVHRLCAREPLPGFTLRLFSHQDPAGETICVSGAGADAGALQASYLGTLRRARVGDPDAVCAELLRIRGAFGAPAPPLGEALMQASITPRTRQRHVDAFQQSVELFTAAARNIIREIFGSAQGARPQARDPAASMSPPASAWTSATGSPPRTQALVSPISAAAGSLSGGLPPQPCASPTGLLGAPCALSSPIVPTGLDAPAALGAPGALATPEQSTEFTLQPLTQLSSVATRGAMSLSELRAQTRRGLLDPASHAALRQDLLAELQTRLDASPELHRLQDANAVLTEAVHALYRENAARAEQVAALTAEVRALAARLDT